MELLLQYTNILYPTNFFAGVRIPVCINEPANCRVIVPALQVVEARIRVVTVAPVAEGVVGGYIGGCLGDGCAAGVVDSGMGLPQGSYL